MDRDDGIFTSNPFFPNFPVELCVGLALTADVRNALKILPFYFKLPQVHMTWKFVGEFDQLWELEEFRKFDSVSGNFKATRSWYGPPSQSHEPSHCLGLYGAPELLNLHESACNFKMLPIHGQGSLLGAL